MVLLAGCATAGAPVLAHGPGKGSFEQQSEAIAQQERECEQAAANSHDAAAPPVGSPLPAVKAQTPAACKAAADRANSALASRQRARYEASAHDARARATLMMTLTTSLQH